MEPWLKDNINVWFLWLRFSNTQTHTFSELTVNSRDVFSILKVSLYRFYGTSATCPVCVTVWCHLNTELARQPRQRLWGISGNQQWGLTWDRMKLVSIVSWLWFTLFHLTGPWLMSEECVFPAGESVGGGEVWVIIAHFTERIESEPVLGTVIFLLSQRACLHPVCHLHPPHTPHPTLLTV